MPSQLSAKDSLCNGFSIPICSIVNWSFPKLQGTQEVRKTYQKVTATGAVWGPKILTSQDGGAYRHSTFISEQD